MSREEVLLRLSLADAELDRVIYHMSSMQGVGAVLEARLGIKAAVESLQNGFQPCPEKKGCGVKGEKYGITTNAR